MNHRHCESQRMPFESRSLLRLRFVDQDRDRSAWRACLIGVPNSGIQSTKNRLECPECFMMDFASPRRLQAYRKERHRRERGQNRYDSIETFQFESVGQLPNTVVLIGEQCVYRSSRYARPTACRRWDWLGDGKRCRTEMQFRLESLKLITSQVRKAAKADWPIG